MYSKKELAKKLIMDIIFMLIGLGVTSVILYSIQTSFSQNRQKENSEIKFDVAMQRLETHQTEADEYLQRFDAFSQAKADAISYFYSENPEQVEDVTGMAAQWGLKELYVLDNDRNVVESNGESAPNIKDNNIFGGLFSDGSVVKLGNIRYYASRINDEQILLAGRDCTDCMAYIDEVTDLSTSLSTIKVGSTGHIEVVRASDNIILYDPDENLIGKTLQGAGFRRESYEPGYNGWIKYNGEEYYSECIDAGDGMLMMSMVPRSEILQADEKMVALAVSVFGIIALILIIYIHLIRVEENEWRQTEGIAYYRIHHNVYFNKSIGKKIKKVLIIGIVSICTLSFYVQTLGALSAQSVRSDTKEEDIEDIFDENQSKVDDLVNEYNEEYIGRTRNIAYLLKLDPDLVDDEKLTILAQKAQIKFIYVFNENGSVDATNAVYKDFQLSTNEEDQSYPFWNVIRGYKDILVQEAAEDDTAEHAYLQYIGCKREDAKGMVQLGISPQRLENRLKTVQPAYVLNTISVENKGYLIGIDEETHNIIYSDIAQDVGKSAAELGFRDAAFIDDYSGYQTINSQSSFVTSNIYKGTIICVVVPLFAIESGRVIMTLVVSGISILIILLIALGSLIEKRASTDVQVDERTDHHEKGHEKAFIDISTRASGEKKRVQSAASRWSDKKNIPWSECMAEEKMMKILGWMAAVIGIALVFYVQSQQDTYDKNSILSYIIHMKWEKVPNVFSVTYVVLVVLQVIVLAAIVRKVITLITRNIGARAETIGRLLDSFIKYMSVICALFYCMNFLGVDASTLLASAGLLSVVIGLGAQSLIGDILAGIFIVFEGEFRVGDIVTIDGWRGTVLEIGVRSTKVEEASGNIKILNNSKITGVINMTKKYSYASCDVGIEYDESIERVERVLHDELPKIKEKLTAIENGPFYKGVVELADSSVVIRIIAQCQESDRVQLGRDLNREIKVLFDHYNIGIAYPQIVIHQPATHAKATRKDISSSEEFVKQQKEEAQHLVVSEN